MQSNEPHPALTNFDPAVQAWFAAALGTPTAPQIAAWPRIQAGENLLLAAPTGTGKTLAAFLACLDSLVRAQRAGALSEEVTTIYISPLRALTHDIERNLKAPLAAIGRSLSEAGIAGSIRVGARTGDTSPTERARHKRRPPQILVTTPESLWILLGSAGGRALCKTAHTVILDEIHALAWTRRGAHLALSLERLESLRAPGKPLQRIGLSATQRPLDLLARFLGGRDSTGAARPVAVVDLGHIRPLDLDVLVPGELPLGAIATLAHTEAVDRQIAELAALHGTTLVFVSARREAERTAHRLSALLGQDQVSAHHGSLARERRQAIEGRFQRGELRVLVATASLELGIDVGFVDLVVQLGAPRGIAVLLQRVGRSGHAIDRTPKGRILPRTRGELLEALAAVRAVRAGDLDPLLPRRGPRDVLLQHLIAEIARDPQSTAALLALVRRAEPYADFAAADLHALLHMAAEGFETPAGLRGRHLLAPDGSGRWMARKGAAFAALLGGTAIPEQGDYAVLPDGADHPIGRVHEDFAVESLPGDVFALGNESYRVLRIARGTVHVVPASGQHPSMPFWRGEAPCRTPVLSAAVARTRADLVAAFDRCAGELDAAVAHCAADFGASASAVREALLAALAQRRALRTLPSTERAVIEILADEAGGTQLLIHAPLGAQRLRGLALLLRKRLCRRFDQELQAAATDDGCLISLGPRQVLSQEEFAQLLAPVGVRSDLEQAVLGTPIFPPRWRAIAVAALVVPRRRFGKSRPYDLVRAESDDLLAAVFPAQAACQEHRHGPLEIPDHPLIRQALDDALEEALDADGVLALLQARAERRFEFVWVSASAPSQDAEALLGARPFAFLDDAPLEERRSRLVRPPPRGEHAGARDAEPPIDATVLAEVQAAVLRVPSDLPGWSAWLHDRVWIELAALPLEGFATAAPGIEQLVAAGAAQRSRYGARELIVHAQHQGILEALAADGDRAFDGQAGRSALMQAIRGRAGSTVPLRADHLERVLCAPRALIDAALATLWSDGILVALGSSCIAEGAFTDRSVRAQLDRVARARRAERFPARPLACLEAVLHAEGAFGEPNLPPREALRRALDLLAGFEFAVRDWESAILAPRVPKATRRDFDALFAEGAYVVVRISSGSHASAATPCAIWPSASPLPTATPASAAWRGPAERLFSAMPEAIGPSLRELAATARLLPAEAEEAARDLLASGAAFAQDFASWRALFLAGAAAPRSWRGVALRAQPSLRPPLDRIRIARARREGAPAEDQERSIERYVRMGLRTFGVLSREVWPLLDAPISYGKAAAIAERMAWREECCEGRFIAAWSPGQFARPEIAQALAVAEAPSTPQRAAELAPQDPLERWRRAASAH